MAKALFLVYSQPTTAEAEAEYNDWYDNVHLADLVAVPGIVSAHRYRLSDSQMGRGPSDSLPPYLAVYELESDDISAVIDHVRAGSGSWVISEAIAPHSQTGVYEQITAPVTAAVGA